MRDEYDLSKMVPVPPEKSHFRNRKESVRIELAAQDRVAELEPEIDRVLEALGHPEALVTDLSMFSDFGFTDAEADEVSATLGIAVSRRDYLVDAAQRLKDKG